jgi:hypothetical protein
VSETRAVCLRCGSFVLEAEAPVPGIALCAGCLVAAPPARDPIFSYPPRSITWRRIRPFTVTGFVLGCVFGFVTVSEVLARSAHAPPGILLAVLLVVLLLGGCFAVLGELAGLVCLFVAAPFQPMALWKRLLAAKLGLPESGAFELVIFARRHVKVTDLRMPIEIGLLAVSPGGLVFLGERGTRFALEKSAIAKTGSRVMAFLPPRLATKLTLADEREIFLVPLASRSPFESVRLVRELGARLQKSLPSSA